MPRKRSASQPRRIAFVNPMQTIDDFDRYYFYGDLYHGIIDECIAQNAEIDFFLNGGTYPAEAAGRAFTAYDGLLGMFPAFFHKERAVWTQLSRRMPHVLLMSPFKDIRQNYVGNDDDASLSMLVKHLVQEGYHDIGFVTIIPDEYERVRAQAFVDSLRFSGLTPQQNWVFGYNILTRTSIQIHDRFALYEKIISMKKPPRAILFARDLNAYEFLRHAYRQNIKVPRDIAVAGIDGRDLFSVNNGFGGKPLTTIMQDLRSIGIFGTRMLFEIMNGKRPSQGQRILVLPKIRIGKTTQRHSVLEKEVTFRELVNKFINEHYTDPAALHGIYKYTGFSRAYFSRKFREVFGVTYIDYVIDRRMQEAAFMLTNTSTMITAICLEVGYQYHQQFTKMFKKKYGLTPEKYREINSHRSMR